MKLFYALRLQTFISFLLELFRQFFPKYFETFFPEFLKGFLFHKKILLGNFPEFSFNFFYSGSFRSNSTDFSRISFRNVFQSYRNPCGFVFQKILPRVPNRFLEISAELLLVLFRRLFPKFLHMIVLNISAIFIKYFSDIFKNSVSSFFQNLSFSQRCYAFFHEFLQDYLTDSFTDSPRILK